MPFQPESLAAKAAQKGIGFTEIDFDAVFNFSKSQSKASHLNVGEKIPSRTLETRTLTKDDVARNLQRHATLVERVMLHDFVQHAFQAGTPLNDMTQLFYHTPLRTLLDVFNQFEKDVVKKAIKDTMSYPGLVRMMLQKTEQEVEALPDAIFIAAMDSPSSVAKTPIREELAARAPTPTRKELAGRKLTFQ